MQIRTKHAAQSELDQMFWTAVLAALDNAPDLRGEAKINLTTERVPALNAVTARVTIKNQGIRWGGTVTFSLEQLARAYSPEDMMLAAFSRLIGDAERAYREEAAK